MNWFVFRVASRYGHVSIVNSKEVVFKASLGMVVPTNYRTKDHSSWLKLIFRSRVFPSIILIEEKSSKKLEVI